MAAAKYLTIIGTAQTLLPSNDTSAGAADAGKIVALSSTGKLDTSLFPAGLGEDVQVFTAAEAIGAGKLVNIKADGTVQLADASNARVAHGWAQSAIANGAAGSVQFEGAITGLSGLTAGTPLFLVAAGALSATAPTTGIWQVVGYAKDATSVEFKPQAPITLT